MCLITKKNSRKIADKDMRVWKIIATHYDKPDVWFPPYIKDQGPYPFNKPVNVNGVDENSIEEIEFTEKVKMLKVGKGFLHSYYTKNWLCLEPRLFALDAGNIDDNVRFRVCEAIVPKGSFYYRQDKYGVEIASTSLIVFKPKN